MPAARAMAAPGKDALAVNEAPRKAVHEAAKHRTEQSGDPDEDRRLTRSEDVEREGQLLRYVCALNRHLDRLPRITA